MSWGSLRTLRTRPGAGFDGAEQRGPAPRRDTLRSAASRPVSDRRPSVTVEPAELDALLSAYLDSDQMNEAEADDIEGALQEVRRG